jgi:uncharacterized protein (TIGR03435 family)
MKQVLLTLLTVFGQTFDVASIKPIQQGRENIEPTPASLSMRAVSLRASIRWAYNVRPYQITGGPAWMQSDLYDIIAKPASPSTTDQLRSMLQSLLADRFKLAVRRETRELPVYLLTVGKNGPKLKPSTKEPDGPNVIPGATGITVQNATVGQLADLLSGMPIFDRPVLDRTGVNGRFDMPLSLLDAAAAGPDQLKGAIAKADFSNFAFALEQLGLKLEAGKAPMEMVVVESAEKPAPN